MAKSKEKKETKPRKPQPKVTMDVKVTGKLKGTGPGDWGNTVSATFDWEITDKGKVAVTAPCGTTYKFDKKTVAEFAALVDKSKEAKVVFD